MFMNFEVMATFGISALLSFTLSVAVFLFIAARRGLLRVGSRKTLKHPVHHAVLDKKAQIGSPLLVTPTAPPLPMVVELAPLKEYA